MPIELHRDEGLSIEVVETDPALTYQWKGRSEARDPGKFLVPLLRAAIERAKGAKKTLALDFFDLEYMNSSTFSPIVKMLDEANRCGVQVVLEFNQGKKWQSLSFSALKAFETSDGRIRLRGK